MSRSTWACELKFEMKDTEEEETEGHAPRERVSWNIGIKLFKVLKVVTLHVSVWVEIYSRKRHENGAFVTLHVSVWVEIISDTVLQGNGIVTLHVSVWVEITSSYPSVMIRKVTLHVSVWVEIVHILVIQLHVVVTLHVSVWVEMIASKVISHFSMSRSTWACELKLSVCQFPTVILNVTLHVSVWVEMTEEEPTEEEPTVTLHVSVWVEINPE